MKKLFILNLSLIKISLIITLLALSFNPAIAAKITNISDENKEFVGRAKELQSLNEIMQRNKLCGVVGLSGIGKTYLAKKFAQLHNQDHHIIWWIDGSGDIAEQFVDLGSKIKNARLIEKLPTWGQRKIDTVINFLKNTNYKWIIIFDNLAQAKELEKYELIKQSSNGKILITSRNQDIASEEETLKLQNLEALDSLKLLHKFLPKTDQEELKQLAATLHHYPLYLVYVGSYLQQNRSSITVREYIKLHESKINIKISQDFHNKSKNYILPAMNKQQRGIMREILDIIKATSPKSYELLKVGALLDNNNISKNLLKQIMNEREDEDFYNALSVLNKYSLLAVEKEDKTDTIYSMHDAVQELIKGRIDKLERLNILNRINGSILGKILQDPNSSYDYLGKNIYLVKSIKKMLDLYEEDQYCDNNVLELYCRYMEYCLLIKGDFDEVESLMALMNDKFKKFNYKGTLLLARFKLRQAFLAVWKYADYEKSNSYIEDALKLLEHGKTPSNSLSLLALNRLAQNNLALGKVKAAEGYLEQGSKYVKDTLPNTRLELVYYHIRSQVCIDRGDLKQAYEYSNKAIQNLDESMHLEGDDLVAYLRNIVILGRLGNTKESYIKIKSFYEKYCKSAFDKNFLAISLSAMSEIEASLGMLEEAEKNIKRAIAIFEDVYRNKSTRAKADAYRILADIYDQKSQFTDAQGAYLKSEGIYNSLFKIFEVDTISLLYEKLAINGAKLRNPGQTRKYLSLQRKHFGESHVRTFNIVNYLQEKNLEVL